MNEFWVAYIRHVAPQASQREIARRTGASDGTVSRWFSNELSPSAAHAVEFARAYGRPVTEALIAIGLIGPEDVSGQPVELVKPVSLSQFSAVELVDELRARVSEQC